MPDPTPEEIAARRKELVSLRGSLKTRITKLNTYLEKHGVYSSISHIDKHYEKISVEMETMPEVLRELKTLDPNQNHEEIHENMDDDVEELRCLIQKIKMPGLETHVDAIRTARNRDISPVSDNSNTRTHCNDFLRSLPKIEAKRFDGKLENWRTYRDWFIANIHNHEGLTDAQRLDYLKRTCISEAADSIKGFQAPDKNYALAWSVLEKTYNIEYVLILRHCDMLMETPSMKKNSSEEIKKLLNHIQTQILALKALGEDVTSWNTLLAHLILRRLDKETAKEWNRTMQGNKVPEYEEILTFLREEAIQLTSMSSYQPAATSHHSTADSSVNGRSKNQRSGTPRTQTLLANTAELNCPRCKGPHSINTCDQFLALKPLDRIQAARDAYLCLNCLQKGHKTRHCKEGNCATCHKAKHHELLHLNDEEIAVMRSSLSGKTIALVATLPTRDFVVTAVINILDHQQNPIQCRAILDTGASTNFMSDALAKKLKLSRESLTMTVEGLNKSQTAANYLVNTTIQSRITGFTRSLSFLTVNQIGGHYPMEPIDRSTLQLPKNITLADPLFDRPAPVDILISVGTSLSMFCQGQIRLNGPKDPDLILQQTQLGWILGGSALPKAHSDINLPPVQCNLATGAETNETGFDIKKFWELEEVPAKSPHYSKEEELCEMHFKENVTRDDTGRYIVSLPFNEKKVALCNTKQLAEARLRALRRKFSRNPGLEETYRSVLQEYIDLGHMSEVSSDELPDEGFDLPHHAVIKSTSLTTKVRVVFNASAKTSKTAISLNDALMTGPTIQDDIFSLLLRFRSHQYVLTADIEKMYRQFLVREEDRKFQKILWMDTEGRTRTYQLNTITFGVASAPYLAIRCLHQLADDESADFPEAALRIKKDLYVDDLLTGTDSIESAIKLRNDIDSLFKRGGLNLRQWASNDPRLLENLPEGNVNLQLQVDKNGTIKTLGVHWDSQRDTIVYTVQPITKTSQLTRRSILSELAKIFDPLGLLGPVILQGKIIMQQLWRENLEWDDPVPLNVTTEWKSYTERLPLLNNVSFERKIIIANFKEIQLHGFCDASEKAYGACIYLKTIDHNGESRTQLLCAKSRVAPLKTTTLPRLELCSALLLADLYQAVKESLSHEIHRSIFWSDSMVTLHWIKTSPHKLLVFVANRVSGIQEKTKGIEWRHVRTNDNPADHVSRGLTPKEFVDNSQWKEGPSWLNQEESSWPITELLVPADIPEMRKVQCLLASATNEFWERYSSIGRLRRIVALCLRFKNKRRGSITAQELQLANERIIKLVQVEAFSTEIKVLQKDEFLSPNHKLKSLSPFLDGNGLMRVGGRLSNAKIPYSQQHPLLLPKGHINLQITHSQ